MTRFSSVVICAAGLALSSCDYLEKDLADPEPSIADGGQLVAPNPFDGVLDLISILDPKGVTIGKYDESPIKDLLAGQKVDLAFQAFYDTGTYPGNIELRRNRVQERLLVESNRRCNVFKSLVYQLRSKTNFLLGALTTITGVAGGIVTGVDGSRILSGTAGIFSGIKAEFNQELFQNLATQVIVQGVDTRRREVYDAIALKGQSKPINVYPVEAAVKDAIFYHGQCSVIVGFQVARDAIKTVDDPGIMAANRTLAMLTVTRKLLNVDQIDPQEAMDLLQKTNAGLALAGTPLSEQLSKDSLPIRALRQSSENIGGKIETFQRFVQALAVSKDAQGNPPSDEKKKSLEDQKTALLSTLAEASSSVRAALQACNDEAFKQSQDLLAADQAIAAATDEETKVRTQTSRDRTYLSALAVSGKIRLIPKLLGVNLDAAKRILKEGTPKLEQGDPLDGGVVKRAGEEIVKAKSIKVCGKLE